MMINNAPRKPADNELPDSYDELISIEDARWDSKANVRKETPSPQLIKDISDKGFRLPLITRKNPNNNSEYLITDGWQRTQTAKEVGFTHLPVLVCESLEEATDLAESYSRGKEWDKVADYNQDHNRIKDVFIDKQGLSEKKAIEKRTEESPYTEETIKQNYEIAQLPQTVKQLLKEPDERREGFHEDWKIESCISKKNGSLNKENAHYIAKRYNNGYISDVEAVNFATRATKNSDMCILRQAFENYTDGMDVQEAFAKAKNQVISENNKAQFNIGYVGIDKDEKTILSRYISHKYKMSIRQYFLKIIEEEKEDILNNINEEKYKGEQWAFESMRDEMK